MLWATTIKHKEQAQVDPEGGDIFHLTALCLDENCQPGKTIVQVKVGDNVYSIAILEKGKTESCKVDLLFDVSEDDLIICTRGQGTVHVSGYFEPRNPSDPFDIDMDEDGSDEDGDEDEDGSDEDGSDEDGGDLMDLEAEEDDDGSDEEGSDDEDAKHLFEQLSKKTRPGVNFGGKAAVPPKKKGGKK
eukprot:GDKI01047425.1.p2 GENE.GDKI01047425.1~~GDKI01047425.1.p2  ORF type:complete len:188 (-),score=85.25 GDKI01047425.1:145-708(-)